MDYEVLIVDDDPMMLFLHKNLICKSGVCPDPVSFLNGEEVLEYLMEQSYGNCCYTILLDINMPVMNGWQLLEELKAQPLADFIDVAIISSSTDKRDREKAFSYPLVTAFLTKPFFNIEEVRKMKQKRLVRE